MSAAKIHEGMLLLTALTAVLLAAAWAGWRSSLLPFPAAFARKVSLSGRAYQAVDFTARAAKSELWTEPAPQTHGTEWLYEIFAPPTIYYDPERGELSVHSSQAATAAAIADFGLELVGVRREPFRLQLVGFVGGEGNYFGTFENVLTTEHFLARAGRSVPALGVTIVDFKVQRVGVNSSDSMPVNEPVAVAVVRDEQTGEEITLNDRECYQGGALFATVAASDAPDERADLRPGEVFTHGDARFKLREARLMPPAADVAKESPDSPFPEIKILTPRP